MRKSCVSIAATAILLGASYSTADDSVPGPEQLQFNVRMYEGDPLGSVEAGTLKLLCDTRLVTLENRSASLVSGGELPVMRDAKKVEYVPFGRTVELRPSKVQDGKLHLDVLLVNTTVAGNTKERIELHSTSARTLTTVKLGESVKLRWPGASAERQVWVEFTVDAIARVGH
jgi:hypothetical protein